MRYCYHGYDYREGEGISLGIAAVFLYVFLDCTISLVKAPRIIEGIIWLGMMAFSLSFFCLMLMEYLEICRKYTVTNEGLILHYPLRFTVTHTWDKLSEIGICNVHYASRGRIPVPHLVAIRCVVGEEKKGPRHGHGWWASCVYSAMHFRKIITILYTEEKLEEFKRECPLEIIDYRGIRKYSSELPRYTYKSADQEEDWWDNSKS